MDAADQSAREKKGYGDGLTQALTLVVGPVLFGLFGAFLDGKLGTSPALLLIVRALRRARLVRHRLLRVPRPHRPTRRGEAMGATHAVNPEIASADPSVAYEGQIAGDLVRRVLIVSPAVLLVAGLVSGVDGLDQRGHRPGARQPQLPRVRRPHHLHRPALARCGDGRGARWIHRAARDPVRHRARARHHRLDRHRRARCSPSRSSTSRSSPGSRVTSVSHWATPA